MVTKKRRSKLSFMLVTNFPLLLILLLFFNLYFFLSRKFSTENNKKLSNSIVLKGVKMHAVYKNNSENNQKKKDNNVMSMGDEDFYVLKFPHKLWRIVNECNTGAIQWGIYGKTILIDYNLFQAQYLECEVPKFKTRNMTSFVRQLNMYGFKKMQTQVKNDSSRCCNIHEFFHNCFRFGRNDLLDSVKRRPTPLKNTRVVQNLEYHNQSRLQMCRAAFAKALQKSRDRLHQGARGFSIIGQEGNVGESVPETHATFNFQVIPVENSLKNSLTDTASKNLTVEVSSEFQDYIDMNPDSQDSKNDSENSSVEENVFENQELELTSIETDDQSIHYLNQNSLGEPETDFFMDVNKSSVMRGNHSVQVKKGFDGSNYVIDLMVGCPDEGNMYHLPGLRPSGGKLFLKIQCNFQENVVTKVLETELYNGEENQEVEIRTSECLIVINSSPMEENQTVLNADMDRRERCESNGVEEFYDSITKSYLGL